MKFEFLSKDLEKIDYIYNNFDFADIVKEYKKIFYTEKLYNVSKCELEKFLFLLVFSNPLHNFVLADWQKKLVDLYNKILNNLPKEIEIDYFANALIDNLLMVNTFIISMINMEIRMNRFNTEQEYIDSKLAELN